MNKDKTTIEVDADLTLEQYLEKYPYNHTRSFTKDDWEMEMTEQWQNLQPKEPARSIEVDALEWWGRLTIFKKDNITVRYYQRRLMWPLVGNDEKIFMYKSEHPTVPTVENDWNKLKEDSEDLQALTSAEMQEEDSSSEPLSKEQWIAEFKNLSEHFINTVELAWKLKNDKTKLFEDNKILRDALQKMEGSFYMDICRAYNAGKQGMNNQHEDAMNGKNFSTLFVSSHDYFKSEFPELTKNVP